MGKRIAAKITGVAGYVPPRVVTNSDLEKKVDTNDEWIRTRTGIRERRYADPGVATSHLGTEAARKLLAARGVDPEEIDMIVVASVTPDMFFPATACLIQDHLGAKNAWGFDLSAACSGFVYALTVGAEFVGSGSHKKVLVIGSDVMTSILDFTDRATCVLFGDGAGAVLLEPATSDKEGILDFAHDIDGSGGVQSLYARRGFVASGFAADRGETDALRAPGRRAGFQVRGAADERVGGGNARAERIHDERSGAGGAASSQFANHSRDAGTAGRGRFEGDD